MTVYLLDINMLLALMDPMHLHHEPSHRWFEERGRWGWATCPITENGFVRIASHPNYPNRQGEVPVLLSILAELRESPGHHFWTEDLSILEILESDALITHPQITDVYLLGLAASKRGKLATLDRRIPVEAVRGGRQALECVIGRD